MSEPSRTPMSMCPMAETCRGMTQGRRSGLGLWIPGLVFVGLGILIVIEPRILAWVIAAAFVLLGLMLWMVAGFIRRIGRRFDDTARPGT